jgi:hypothetical protein
MEEMSSKDHSPCYSFSQMCPQVLELKCIEKLGRRREEMIKSINHKERETLLNLQALEPWCEGAEIFGDGGERASVDTKDFQ